MRTFRWTVPEPGHVDPSVMRGSELAYWRRVRASGVEWYVVGKAVVFLVLYPLLGHLGLGRPLEAALFTEAWLLGLATGYSIWLRREYRYQRSLDRGLVSQAQRGESDG